jgi:hypothetical protein
VHTKMIFVCTSTAAVLAEGAPIVSFDPDLCRVGDCCSLFMYAVSPVTLYSVTPDALLQVGNGHSY